MKDAHVDINATIAKVWVIILFQATILKTLVWSMVLAFSIVRLINSRRYLLTLLILTHHCATLLIQQLYGTSEMYAMVKPCVNLIL